MNFWQKIHKNSILIASVAAILLLLLAIFIRYEFVNSKTPENLSADFQKTFLHKEAILDNQIKHLLNYFEEHKSVDDDSLEKQKDLFFKEGLGFFVYRNDTLVYWSTNAIPVKKTASARDCRPDGKLFLKSNGFYVEFTRKTGQTTIVGMILVKNSYPFENDYLKNEYQKEFPVPDDVMISREKTGDDIFNSKGKYLFSLKFNANTPIPDDVIYTLFFIYLVIFVLLTFILYRIYEHFRGVFAYPWLFILSFILDIIILRALILWLKVPRLLYHSFLFGPVDFSSSAFFPSLGDFVVNSAGLLIISYVFYLNFPLLVKRVPEKPLTKIISGTLVVIIVLAALAGLIFLVRNLVLNSNIPFNLQNISEFNMRSLLAFIILSSLFLAYFFLFIRLYRFFLRLSGIVKIPDTEGAGNTRFTLTSIVVFLIVFSFIATAVLNHYNVRLEKGKRQLLALKLGSERDPEAEMMFLQNVPKIKKDSVFRIPLNYESHTSFEDSIVKHIRKKYFADRWNNYNIQVTVCYGDKQLRIQPQNYLTGCEDYFQKLIHAVGKPTLSELLYYLDYGYGYQNYLAVIPLKNESGQKNISGSAYIEISSKLVFRDLGYPELLIDKKNNHLPDIAGYSYAFYRNGDLIHRVGKYFYSLELDHVLNKEHQKAHFYVHDGMSHYCYPIDKNNVLIVSKKAETFLDQAAPFSYLFFGFALFSMLFFFTVRMPLVFNLSSLRLRDRLQVSMTAMIISSLLIVGFLILYYIVRLNDSKNRDNLTDRTHSILVELQHKFGTSDDLSKLSPDELGQMLNKFSNVFFSDINLFSPQGVLLGTSRPQIFEEGLVSPLMNYKVLEQFRTQHSSFITLEESIGRHTYLSSYIPFYNDDNELLAYLNLPYFAQQEDLKKEISTFLIAFINIYVFLIILGIIVALIIANYISRPLRLLTASLGRLTLAGSNEKLEWHREDEIGKLVSEYNRVTEELAQNAELLARSERETAWREMARQVAHEIKNPLTPMMLSVQHLEKAWKEHAPDWDQRLLRFTENMTEQIESLSAIATEFSDFAKMPQTQNEKLELKEVIGNVVSLYRDNIPIIIRLKHGEEAYPVVADRKQILRVFTNLINNSVQAIGNDKGGEITVTMERLNDIIQIHVKDNGSGMSKDQARRIFQPNFTTKSGGTGLGLAIVESIVLGAGGEITFETEEGKGTTFTVRFPVAKD